MKKIQKLSLPFLLFTIMLFLTSAVVFPIKSKDDLAKERMNQAVELIKSSTSDGSGLSFSEIKDIVTTVKGTKLSFKEKITLRIFKKKIGNALEAVANENSGGKSQLVAGLLCFFLGGLGIHRFYLGYTWQGVVQLLTLGGLGIWVLIDFIRILVGDLKPKGDDYGKKL